MCAPYRYKAIKPYVRKGAQQKFLQVSEDDVWFQDVCTFFFIAVFFFLHVCPLWILIAHLLQALLQMLAGLAWNDYRSQIPLASFPVTLLHEDGTRAGAEAETGAGAGAGLSGDRRQQAQEINTSTRASPRSNIQLQLDQRRRNGWLAMMSSDKVGLGSLWLASDAPPGSNSGKYLVPIPEQNPKRTALRQ